MTCDCSVGGLGLNGLAIGAHEYTGHKTEGTIAWNEHNKLLSNQIKHELLFNVSVFSIAKVDS